MGKNIDLSELTKKYDAVFLAFGANCSSKMGAKGEELEGVFGGNVAMDCARTIKRLRSKRGKSSL